MRRALEALKYKLMNRKWKFLDVVHLLMLGVSVVIFVNVTVRLNMLHQERVAYKNMYETLRMVKDMDTAPGEGQGPAPDTAPGSDPEALTGGDASVTEMEQGQEAPVPAEGEVAPMEGPPGEGVQGEVPQGEGSQGEVPQGEVPQGDVPQGEGSQGEVPQGEGSQGEVPQGEVPQGEGSQGEVPQGEGSPGEVPQGDGVPQEGGVAQDEGAPLPENAAPEGGAPPEQPQQEGGEVPQTPENINGADNQQSAPDANPGYGALGPAVGSPGDNPMSLTDTLKGVHDARGNNVVILTIVDADYMDMAHNFYETSIVPFGLQDNFIFMSSWPELCNHLRAQGANCYVHVINPTRTEELQKLEYRRKLRGETVLAALNANLTVLHTHVDVAFLKSPLPDLACDSCEVQTFNDVMNGDRITLDFTWLRPTEHTLLIWKTFTQTSLRDITGPSVDSFNRAVRQYKPYTVTRILEPSRFMPGVQFFEDLNHTFAGDAVCDACVVVHNNWIVTRAAKIYRFKENHLWNYDKDGYYSSADARYIVYENPVMFGNATWDREREALRSALALGRVLNRIVVLPRFHCGNIMCGVNSLFSVASLDAVFGANYREHTFLKHSKVPEHIKVNTTDLMWIDAGALEGQEVDMQGAVSIPLTLPEGGGVIINDEIINIFHPYKPYPVLKFHSLYNVYAKFMEKKPEFERDIEKGLIRDVYRQHKTSWRL